MKQLILLAVFSLACAGEPLCTEGVRAAAPVPAGQCSRALAYEPSAAAGLAKGEACALSSDRCAIGMPGQVLGDGADADGLTFEVESAELDAAGVCPLTCEELQADPAAADL